MSSSFGKVAAIIRFLPHESNAVSIFVGLYDDTEEAHHWCSTRFGFTAATLYLVHCGHRKSYKGAMFFTTGSLTTVSYTAVKVVGRSRKGPECKQFSLAGRTIGVSGATCPEQPGPSPPGPWLTLTTTAILVMCSVWQGYLIVESRLVDGVESIKP